MKEQMNKQILNQIKEIFEQVKKNNNTKVKVVKIIKHK